MLAHLVPHGVIALIQAGVLLGDQPKIVGAGEGKQLPHGRQGASWPHRLGPVAPVHGCKAGFGHCQDAEELHILAPQDVQHVALQLGGGREALRSCHMVAAQSMQASNRPPLPILQMSAGRAVSSSAGSTRQGKHQFCRDQHAVRSAAERRHIQLTGCRSRPPAQVQKRFLQSAALSACIAACWAVSMQAGQHSAANMQLQQAIVNCAGQHCAGVHSAAQVGPRRGCRTIMALMVGLQPSPEMETSAPSKLSP